MICESPPGGAKHAEVESPRERGVREVEAGREEMSSRVPRLMNDDGEVVMMQRCNRRGQTDKWARVAPAANPMNRISSCSDASIRNLLSELPIHFGNSPSLPPALVRIYLNNPESKRYQRPTSLF